VDAARQRFSVTLKPSLAGASDASLLASLFADLELAARLQAAQDAAAGEAAIDWGSLLAVGCTIGVQVSEVKAYGVLCDMAASEDLVALMPPGHAPAAPKAGQQLQARVLDVDKELGSVEVSAAPGAAAGDKKAAKKADKLKPGDKVGAALVLATGVGGAGVGFLLRVVGVWLVGKAMGCWHRAVARLRWV
jgi:rRNA biogenesis protein RRP5